MAVPNGTLWEPNLLGSYLAAGGVLALATLLITQSRQRATGLAGWLRTMYHEAARFDLVAYSRAARVTVVGLLLDDAMP